MRGSKSLLALAVAVAVLGPGGGARAGTPAQFQDGLSIFSGGSWLPVVIKQTIVGGVITTTFSDASTASLDTGASAAATAANQALMFGQVSAVAYTAFTPATGATVAMPSNTGLALIKGTGALLALTVLLPPSPIDRQIARISTQVSLTTLTVKDSAANALVNGTISTVGPFGASNVWQYQGSTWQRIE